MVKFKSLPVVLDASVVAKLLIKEKSSKKTAGLFSHFISEQRVIYEPHFLKAEVYSLVRKKVVLKKISLFKGGRVLELFNRLGFSYFREDDRFFDFSFELARKLKQTVVYDCLYLALAWQMKADFVTADLKFLKQAKKVYLNSFSLSDYVSFIKKV